MESYNSISLLSTACTLILLVQSKFCFMIFNSASKVICAIFLASAGINCGPCKFTYPLCNNFSNSNERVVAGTMKDGDVVAMVNNIKLLGDYLSEDLTSTIKRRLTQTWKGRHLHSSHKLLQIYLWKYKSPIASLPGLGTACPQTTAFKQDSEDSKGEL